MKKLLIIFFVFFNFIPCKAENLIVYLDIDHILMNSNVGISIDKYISSIETQKKKEFENNEKKLLDEEKKILSKKKLINEENFNNEVAKLSKKVSDHNITKKKFYNDLNKKKKDYTKKVLKELNIIISEYVKEKEISFVLPKKNVIVAKKNLDITEDILFLTNEKIINFDY